MAACQRFVQLTGLVGGKNSTDQCEGNIDSSSFQHAPVMRPQKCWTDGEDHLGDICIRTRSLCAGRLQGEGAQQSCARLQLDVRVPLLRFASVCGKYEKAHPTRC